MANQKEQRKTIAFRVPVSIRNKLLAESKANYRTISLEAERLMMAGMKVIYGEESVKEAA